ncbi:MAG TPA: TlpA disulfide reductase family protein [Gemmatimonadales bacterium]
MGPAVWPSGRLAVQGGLAVGSPAPAVTINDLDGKPVAFSDFIGKKPALIQFWATWCELCERLDPKVRAAAERYGAEVEFIGVNVTVNQKVERVRRWVAEHKPAFRVLWDNRGVAVRAYDVPSTSFIAIIDAKGKVAYTGVGADQDLDAALRKVVGR